MIDVASLDLRVAEVIRSSEVRAVADLIRSGGQVRIGQVVDYFVDPEPSAPGPSWQKSRLERRRSPYRVAVEQWHLEAARMMLSELREK